MGTDIEPLMSRAVARIPDDPHKPLQRADLTRLQVLANKLSVLPGIGRYAIAPEDAPTAAEREAFERRNRNLVLEFAAARPQQVAERVLKFFAGFGQFAMLDQDEAERRMNIYVAALVGLPDWAIRDGMVYALRHARNPQHPPTAAELRSFGDAALADLQDEHRLIEAVLSAKVEAAPESVERRRDVVDRHWASRRGEWNQGLDPSADERRQRVLAECAAASDRLRERDLAAHGVSDGRVMSVALRRQLEEVRRDAREPSGSAGGST